MTAQRPDLDEIRRQYQVEDDQMTTYTPRFFGIPLADGRQMTQTEADLLDGLSYRQLHTFKNISQDALAQARQQFPLSVSSLPAHVSEDRAREWLGTDGHQDAFRHAYWSAQLTREFGEEWARAFTTAHEAVPANRPTPEAMDLYNNAVGISIARENPNASQAELATLVKDAIRNGEMVVVGRNGQLEWSDRVQVGQHGLAPRDEPLLDGQRAVPDAIAPYYGAASGAPSGRDMAHDTHPARATPDWQSAEPALGTYLAALQSGDQAAIRDAATELLRSPAGQRMAQLGNQLQAERQQHEAQTTHSRQEHGPSLG